MTARKAASSAAVPRPAWGMVAISLVALAAGELVAKAIGADSGVGAVGAAAAQ